MTLSLREAWLVLGRRPGEVARAVMSDPDRAAAADRELAKARRLAKRLMVVHHPDQNSGDPEARSRFDLVMEAVRTIEGATEELKREPDGAKERSVFIEVDIT